MSNLRKKLSRLSLPGAAALPVSRFQTRWDGWQAQQRRRAQRFCAAPPLPGEVVETDFGAMHVVRQTHPSSHCHGEVGLHTCLQVSAAHLALLALDAALHGLDVTRLLFVDTETTGLAGGAGTLPFLVGTGWFEEGSFHVEQLLLRRPGEEVPILRRLAERLAWASAMVTYNGKSFDWPLLRTRFVLNRVEVPQQFAHIDLLHCARRVLRRRTGPLRLVNLETDLLGFERQDDIDGAQIPATYFRYLRGAPGSVLTPILTHNVHDLLAMVATLGSLGARLAAPELASDNERLCMAELTLRAGQWSRAATLAQAATGAANAVICSDAHRLVARLARRRGDPVAAAAALHAALLAGDGNGQAAVHLALAKLYEHRMVDLRRALHHARAAAAAEPGEAHARRLARLQRKLQRAPAAVSATL